MRIGILAIVSGVALSLSAAAWAAETGNEQTVVAKDDSQKIICHYVVHQGALMPKPYCGTQYQWDKERRRAQQVLWEYQLRATQRRIM